MNAQIDNKRTVIFLAFAFGIAWATALVIYLTGGLTNSPMIVPGIPLAVVLLASAYMWSPALANIFTRLITREGWSNTGLRPNFRRGWPLWIAAWFLPGILTILGAVVYFLIFPQHFDATLSTLTNMLESTGQAGLVNPWFIVITQTVAALLISPLLNSIATFGEEFGWRGYLLPKLMPLGGRNANLLLGVIWGVWHWPVIFMGYEYGLEYPGAPFVGPLLFLAFTITGTILLSWVTLRGKSVWPAVIGHAAINGIAGLATLFVIGDPNPLLGPLPVGIIGMAGYILMAVILWLTPGALAGPASERIFSEDGTTPAERIEAESPLKTVD